MAESEIMEARHDIEALKKIVRVGRVSSVDVENRTARVLIEDKVKPFVSGPLKVLQNQPLITITKKENGAKWNFEAHYASADRKLGLGEDYTKSAPDIIKLDRSIDYKCPLHGVDETKSHEHEVKVYPWLPYEGQFVLCLYLPNGESDGFVLGGF